MLNKSPCICLYISISELWSASTGSSIHQGILVVGHHVNIEISVCLADTQYDIFDVQLILGGCGFLVCGP